MILLLLPLLALEVQERPDPRPPFRATLTIEHYLRREDRVSLESGELSVRPGEALLYQSPRHKVLLRDGRAYERKAGERSVKAWDLGRSENFQPLDLWRSDARTIREKFREIDDAAAAPRDLPPAVVTAEGKPLPPVTVNPPRESFAWTDGIDRAEGCARVLLVPREPGLRSRISSIRLSVDRATGRILRAVVDSPAQILTLTLGDVQEDPSMRDAVFEWDLSNVKVEDR
jgi:hypothetical protein